MEKNEKKQEPRYIKIALDIAFRISNNELKIGEKLRGRSTLSSEYNVSPETIRRSVSLLRDMQVVDVFEKSGIYIKSKENALTFIKTFNTKNNINELRKRLRDLQNQKSSIEEEMNKTIDLIIEYSIQFKNIGTKDSYEIKVDENSALIGKTIADTEFWKNTGSTITAIKRQNELLVSPGPYFVFYEGDIIVFVCNDSNIKKVEDFLIGE